MDLVFQDREQGASDSVWLQEISIIMEHAKSFTFK